MYVGYAFSVLVVFPRVPKKSFEWRQLGLVDRLNFRLILFLTEKGIP